MLERNRDKLDYVSDILLRRETIEREQFIQLLDGKSEEDVFGPDEPVYPSPPPPPPQPERKPVAGPKPLPRPGFGTGDA